MAKVNVNDVKEGFGDIRDSLQKLAAVLTTFNSRLGRLENLVATLVNQRAESVDKMADKLIEMAMVNGGHARGASLHRQVARPEQPDEVVDNWAEVADDWPPPNSDVMNMP